MSTKQLATVVNIAFFEGGNPSGPVLATANFQTASGSFILPQVGVDFIWLDNENGGGYRGNVARAGTVEVIENASQVTQNIQIQCVSSIRQ
ncbi:MAG: hypothetical protein C0606_05030 [Hyphomicrobiales bacterium]|nr:MAG: hypothetical protein C0606_05030 [Hyphomicrobiales bacterium]